MIFVFGSNEAVGMAKALNAQRRERNWKRAQVLREVTPNAKISRPLDHD